MIELSVIIPVFNEEKNVKILINQFNKILKRNLFQNIEVLFVNDGSTDRTKNIKFKNKKIRLLNLKKNYGQSIAIQAGIEKTIGKYVCIMDGDLQSKPEDIFKLYNKIKKNKCLIKINNKSLIKNIIDNSSNADISEINIITGFKPQNIKKELKSYNKIKFTNNSKYQTTDMVYSSIIGLKKSQSDTIISYTDIIYTKKLFQIIKKSNNNFITIPYIKNWKRVWNKRDKNIFEDAETFKVDKNSNLKEIGNKIDKKNLKSVNGQFMGIVFIPKKFINLIINKYNIYSNSKLQLTQFVNKLIKDNIKIKCVNYNDFWYEIDDYEDLINYKKSKKKSLK